MEIAIAVACCFFLATMLFCIFRDVFNDGGIHKRDFWVYGKMTGQTVSVNYGFLNKKTKDFEVELRKSSSKSENKLCSYSAEVLFLNGLLIAEIWRVYTPIGSKTMFDVKITKDTRKVLRKVKKVCWKEFFKAEQKEAKKLF